MNKTPATNHFVGQTLEFCAKQNQSEAGYGTLYLTLESGEKVFGILRRPENTPEKLLVGEKFRVKITREDFSKDKTNDGKKKLILRGQLVAKTAPPKPQKEESKVTKVEKFYYDKWTGKIVVTKQSSTEGQSAGDEIPIGTQDVEDWKLARAAEGIILEAAIGDNEVEEIFEESEEVDISLIKLPRNIPPYMRKQCLELGILKSPDSQKKTRS